MEFILDCQRPKVGKGIGVGSVEEVSIRVLRDKPGKLYSVLNINDFFVECFLKMFLVYFFSSLLLLFYSAVISWS